MMRSTSTLVTVEPAVRTVKTPASTLRQERRTTHARYRTRAPRPRGAVRCALRSPRTAALIRRARTSRIFPKICRSSSMEVRSSTFSGVSGSARNSSIPSTPVAAASSRSSLALAISPARFSRPAHRSSCQCRTMSKGAFPLCTTRARVQPRTGPTMGSTKALVPTISNSKTAAARHTAFIRRARPVTSLPAVIALVTSLTSG
jgi:hypothetical protein